MKFVLLTISDSLKRDFISLVLAISDSLRAEFINLVPLIISDSLNH
jgi:hypothetical protein